MLVLDVAYVFNRFCHSPLLSVTQVLTDIGTCANKKDKNMGKKRKSEQQTQLLYKLVFLNEYGRLVISSCFKNKDKHNDSTVKMKDENIGVRTDYTTSIF